MFHCDVATTAIRIRKWKFQRKQRGEFNSNVNNGGENVLWRMAPSSTSCFRVARARVRKNHSNKDRNYFDLGNSQIQIETAYYDLTIQLKFPENVKMCQYKRLRSPLQCNKCTEQFYSRAATLLFRELQLFPVPALLPSLLCRWELQTKRGDNF